MSEQEPTGRRRRRAEGRRPIRRALVSVYDKTGLEELASALHAAGVAIVSTGSTAARIAAAGVPVTAVEELTGFPECLDGRVKTLHPRVHAGLLADVGNPDHVRQLSELEIEPFELVVSNLYPFRDTVRSGASAEPSASSRSTSVARRWCAARPRTTPTSPSSSRRTVIPRSSRRSSAGGFTLAQRQRLAAEAFAHTASYDVAVASWMGSVLSRPADGSWFPEWTGATWDKVADLRYGENPHQAAALYAHWRPGVAQAEVLHGKAMSYNNYVDTDAAVRCAFGFDQPAVAVIKHANPCGIAVGANIAEAHARAHACDPVSAYGGVVAANRPVSYAMATQLAEIFTEVVAAPSFDDDAYELLSQKKNIRLLELPDDTAPDPVEFRGISGGILAQTVDRVDAVVHAGEGAEAGGDDPSRWRLVSGPAADPATLDDLAFAWKAIRAVRSNAILLARDGASVGVGMGQVNRVDSCRLAVSRAGERAEGSVAASDAFFPFADGLQVLIDAGVRAVVQPGGSIRDGEIIAAAEAAGVTMYLTGTRHFTH